MDSWQTLHQMVTAADWLLLVVIGEITLIFTALVVGCIRIRRDAHEVPAPATLQDHGLWGDGTITLTTGQVAIPLSGRDDGLVARLKEEVWLVPWDYVVPGALPELDLALWVNQGAAERDWSNVRDGSDG